MSKQRVNDGKNLKVAGIVFLILGLFSLLVGGLSLYIYFHPELAVDIGAKPEEAKELMIPACISLGIGGLFVLLFVLFLLLSKRNRDVATKANPSLIKSPFEKKKRFKTIFGAIASILLFSACFYSGGSPLVLLAHNDTPETKNNLIIGTIIFVICALCLIASIIVLISGIKTKLYNRLLGRYENNRVYVPFVIKDNRDLFANFVKVYNIATNQGFVDFIDYDDKRKEIIFESPLSIQELSMQLDCLDRLANGQKNIINKMPSPFSYEDKLIPNVKDDVIDRGSYQEGVYQSVNDYDEVTYEDGIEIDREHHYTSEKIGERTVNYLLHRVYVDFTVTATGKKLKSIKKEIISFTYDYRERL